MTKCIYKQSYAYRYLHNLLQSRRAKKPLGNGGFGHKLLEQKAMRSHGLVWGWFPDGVTQAMVSMSQWDEGGHSSETAVRHRFDVFMHSEDPII